MYSTSRPAQDSLVTPECRLRLHRCPIGTITVVITALSLHYHRGLDCRLELIFCLSKVTLAGAGTGAGAGAGTGAGTGTGKYRCRCTGTGTGTGTGKYRCRCTGTVTGAGAVPGYSQSPTLAVAPRPGLAQVQT